MNPFPLRVLIVDDSRIFRGNIETALAGQPGVRVVGSVWSGEKALELAREQLPDFVTLDIQMPGLGGIATLKALRELAVEWGELPVVLRELGWAAPLVAPRLGWAAPLALPRLGR